LACAARHQHARALDLDHAYAAGVDRRQGVAVAERRLVAPLRAAGVEDGRALADADALAVDLELDGAADGDGDDAHSGSLWLEYPKAVDGGIDRIGGSLPETADACVRHRRRDLAQERGLVGHAAARSVGREAQQRLLLANGADPAGDALPAGL